MNVVDSSGWLEYFADGPNARFFAPAIENTAELVVPVISAAKLSLDFKLPMADSLILATAQAHGATLWTQDGDFEGVAGVRYMPKG